MQSQRQTQSVKPAFQRIMILIIAVLSGRSATALNHSRGDEITNSLFVTLGILTAMILHAGGLAIGITLVGYDFEVAWKIAILPAMALALLDFKFQKGLDLEKSYKIAKEIRPDIPKSMKGGVLGFLFRPLIAVVTGMVIGTFIMLALMSNDTTARLARMQEMEDAKIAHLYIPQHESDRAVFSGRVERAKADLESAIESDPRNYNKERLKTLKKDRLITVAEIAEIRKQLAKQKENAFYQRDLMKCEVTGTRDVTCPNTTGADGKGDAYYLAEDRALRSEEKVKELEQEIKVWDELLEGIDSKMASVATLSNASTEVDQALMALTKAENELLSFNTSDHIDTLVKNHPGRKVYEPNSFSDRFLAMGEIFKENQSLWSYFLLIELAAIAVESLVFVGGLVRRPSEYHLARADLMIAAYDRVFQVVAVSYLEARTTRSNYQDTIMNDNPKIFAINQKLAQVKAKESSAREANKEASLTRHLRESDQYNFFKEAAE